MQKVERYFLLIPFAFINLHYLSHHLEEREKRDEKLLMFSILLKDE